MQNYIFKDVTGGDFLFIMYSFLESIKRSRQKWTLKHFSHNTLKSPSSQTVYKMMQ